MAMKGWLSTIPSGRDLLSLPIIKWNSISSGSLLKRDSTFQVRFSANLTENEQNLGIFMGVRLMWAFIGFDEKDLFGSRRNMNHSPHIKAGIDLDNKIIIGVCLLTAIMFFKEIGFYERWKVLRFNQLKSNMGWVTEDNLK